MLGIENLKETIEITERTVECPVKGCKTKVEKQKEIFKKDDKFECPEHNIYISPSTWEYKEESCNLLWKDESDMGLLKEIKQPDVKRESYRIARNNSEDALTWNVFRFLEKNNLINNFLKEVIGIPDDCADVIYWSYSQLQKGLWYCLKKGREEFETNSKKGSEPDIIILGDKSLIIIEVKLNAGNKIPCKSKNENVKKKYESGGGDWWDKVFRYDFNTLAIKEKKYELYRFWLIGSWMAAELNLNFYLINLTLSNKEKDIEERFKPCIKEIKENNLRIFKRITWEQIFDFISKNNFSGSDKNIVINYFKNKTLGYNDGKIIKAFQI